ncbi:MAG: cytochrome c oxidase assembly protein [Candidatus Nanopelagicales bacterium]
MLPLHSTHEDPSVMPSLLEMWWPLELLPLGAVLIVSTLYVLGVRHLRKQNIEWPLGRTISFVVLGNGTLFLATQGPLAYLDTTLLSTHMVQHMLLSMVAPVFLALGAPVTLLLRVTKGKTRKFVARLLHSRFVTVVSFPLVAGFIYILNPWLLYFTGYYEATLSNSLLHNFNHLHFIMVGSLWTWSLIGIDPMPRMGFGLRLFSVFVTLPFHAFLGLTIMNQSDGIAREYYESLGRLWGPGVLEDQQIAGGLLWAAGDIIGLLLFLALTVQWARASEREARRIDRDLDRQEQNSHISGE